MSRFGYGPFNDWMKGKWKRPAKGMPHAAKAAMASLKKSFDIEPTSLEGLVGEARKLITAKTNNKSM